MLGIRSFPIGFRHIFRGENVSFREGNSQVLNIVYKVLRIKLVNFVISFGACIYNIGGATPQNPWFFSCQMCSLCQFIMSFWG